MQQIQRAARILEFLARPSSPEGTGIDVISSATGLSPSTVHRYLSSLKEVGFVRQDPATAKYSLGYKLAELGSLVINRLDLRTAALPVMVRLRDLTSETICLNIRTDKIYRMYVEIVESNLTVKALPPLAAPIPLYIGAPGRVLSAWLPEAEIKDLVEHAGQQPAPGGNPFDPGRFYSRLEQIRKEGYALGEGELLTGISSVAAPIRNHSGSVTAALSISGPRDRFAYKKRIASVPALLEAAREISGALGCPTRKATLSPCKN